MTDFTFFLLTVVFIVIVVVAIDAVVGGRGWDD